MKLYLDCEFNGYKGELLSIAMINRDHEFYAKIEKPADFQYDPWVLENVVPFLDIHGSLPPKYPNPLNNGVLTYCGMGITHGSLQSFLQEFFQRSLAESDQPNDYIHLISDWPDDIKYMSELLLTGPGTMIDIPGIVFEVKRIDAYPTSVTGAIQHNAWWDAYALMIKDQELCSART